MPTPHETRWWWIRHAPAEKANGCFARADALLAPIAQAAFLGLQARLPEDAMWMASSLPRAVKTCELLKGDSDFTQQPELAEQDFGAWAGRTYDEVWQETKDLAEWNTPALLRPPQGESYADVCARVEKTVTRLTLQHEGNDIICVAHAGVIRAAAGMAAKLPPEKSLLLDVPHLSLYRIAYHGGQWTLVGLQASAA